MNHSFPWLFPDLHQIPDFSLTDKSCIIPRFSSADGNRVANLGSD